MLQLLLVLTTALTGPAVPLEPASPLLGGGGPDAYGYTYIDNDTVAPEAPVYNWVSIRDIGTRINGLADDNVLGPFSIGFEFPYYWYRANSVFVGSNGYITFGDNYLSAHPFQNMPAAARPNNTIAMLMADMDYSRSGSPAKAWYWTSPSNDTFIVECDSVEFWAQSGSNGVNTFQVILVKHDSTITVQYMKQIGTPNGTSPGWIPGNATAGIENVTGAVGLSYLYGNIPARNNIHDTLAVKYIPPATSSMTVHDVASWRVLSENNGAFFVIRNEPKTIWAKVKNTGNQIESDFPVMCVIRNSTNSVVFADTLRVTSLAPGELDSLVFLPDWTPTTNGVYTTRVYTALTGDMFRGNDTVKLESRVITMPAELGYDGGTPTSQMTWNGNSGGFGNRFVPPSYPTEVTQIKAMLNNDGTTVGCTLWLFDDDGPGGNPGTALARGTVTVSSSTPSWYAVDVSPAVSISDGAFFVGANSGGASNPAYSMDSTKPLSFQSWEYTGGWSPSRDAAVQDVVMHALVRLPTGVEELTPARGLSALSAKPNPFTGETRISFGQNLLTPARLEIYSTSGELIRTEVVSGASAVWNGRNNAGALVARGIYFAKLSAGNTTPLKVLLTR